MTPTRDLRPLFEPASVALVGASADPLKWGGWFAMSLVAAAPDRRPHLSFVNRRGGEIHGITCATSLRDLDDPPELVLLTIPGAAVEEAIDDALALGARAIAVIAAGFGERGADGEATQARLVERVRAAGAVLLGPNCLGLLDSAHGLHAAGSVYQAGPVGFASQSGNLAIEIGMKLEAEGLGFSRFASVGNQADVTAADVLRSMVEHDPTRVAIAYVEDPRDGRAFADAIAALADAGKRTLVLKAGRSDEGARAAQSHTGSLAGSARVFAAAVRDAGGIVVRSPAELVERSKTLASGRRLPRRARVAIVADGGGHAVVATDLLADAGFALARLAPATAAAIQPYLPNSDARNPVDLAGAGEMDVRNFGRIATPLLAAEEIDAVLFSGYFGGYVQYSEEAGRAEVEVADALADACVEHRTPLIVQSMQVPLALPAIVRLRERGVPCYSRVEDAVDGLASIRETRVRRPVAATRPTVGLAARPTYVDARALLAAAGVRFEAGGLARDADEAAAIAGELGVPVAVKAVGADLLHKSDAGGVALGLTTSEAVAAAARDMLTRLDGLDGVFVEAMAAPGLDLVVGASRDRAFGPIVLVGLGGIFVEVLDDVAICLAPAEPDTVAAGLAELRAAPLLAGARGGEPVDVAAVARAAAIVGDILAANPDIAELEINPLRAFASGVVALDARCVRTAA